MKETLDVTVIMAVYNSARFLEAACLSVLAETTSDMELILVDDGSTDGSAELCEAIAQRDSRVVVVHKKNGGMCQARNFALERARGEYVTFVDNDDLVLKGFVDANLAVARKFNADVVRFGRIMQRINSKDRVLRAAEVCPTRICCFQGSEIRRNLELAHYGSDGVWTGLYRTQMLRNERIIFPESFRSGMEDVWFNDQVIRVANSYAFNNHSYYVWKRRSDHSTSMKLSPNRFDSIRDTLAFEFEMMNDYRMTSFNPNWCSERLFLLTRDCLTTAAYRDDGDMHAENVVYEQIRELLLPYSHFMRSYRPCGVDGLMFSLLVAKRYGCLRRVISAGVGIKRFIGK